MTKEKRKVKEELTENNTRGSLGCWEDMLHWELKDDEDEEEEE
jgi:hypothetical protein